MRVGAHHGERAEDVAIKYADVTLLLERKPRHEDYLYYHSSTLNAADVAARIASRVLDFGPWLDRVESVDALRDQGIYWLATKNELQAEWTYRKGTMEGGVIQLLVSGDEEGASTVGTDELSQMLTNDTGRVYLGN